MCIEPHDLSNDSYIGRAPVLSAHLGHQLWLGWSGDDLKACLLRSLGLNAPISVRLFKAVVELREDKLIMRLGDKSRLGHWWLGHERIRIVCEIKIGPLAEDAVAELVERQWIRANGDELAVDSKLRRLCEEVIPLNMEPRIRVYGKQPESCDVWRLADEEASRLGVTTRLSA